MKNHLATENSKKLQFFSEILEVQIQIWKWPLKNSISVTEISPNKALG